MSTAPKLTQLVEYDQTVGKVLTIVVDVDQSLAVNRNHGFETSVNAKLREIESGIKDRREMEQFTQSADLGRRLIQAYRPQTKSLVLFLQANGNVTTRELHVPMKTAAVWAETPHIQPLIEAEDEFEEVLIVLLDGRESRLLTSRMGILTEHSELLNPFPVSHTQAAGNDRQKSQPTFHRKADEREHHYLKAVSEDVEGLAESRSIRRIIIAGSEGTAKELYSLLSRDAQKHVIAIEVLPANASLDQIGDTARKAQLRAEREYETSKVASLLDRAGAGQKAVTGLAATVLALAEGRVHLLVYAQGISPRGAQCRSCGCIVVDHPVCPKCNAAAGLAGDVMDLIIGSALDTGASIEQVRGEAAEKLAAAGSIGAFLRH
jgi:peptide subunit release factor 1 (eRF1)